MEDEAPKRGMSDSELLTLIKQYEQASLGSEVAAGATISTTVYPSNQAMTTLQVDRYNALNAYQARPLGNEIENRSQVVLPVIRDTMSWIMPQLMRMFAASKTICRFEPENESDESQADMETEVVNQVFMTQNDGILILHDFFWDALLLRNGYVQVHTREWKSIKQEKYSGLTPTNLAQLLQDTADEKLEVLEQREYERDLPVPTPQTPPPVVQGQPPQMPQVPLVQKVAAFDLKIRRTRLNKRCAVMGIPPEEMRVTPRARMGMEDLSFCEHMTLKTRSDLITEGFDANTVNGLSPGRPSWLDIDALARNKLVDQLSLESPSDKSMQEIEVRTVVILVDYDGDGVAELRKVIVGGDQILENEVIEETCYVSGAAIRMPHRHTGLSIYDLVMDLQVIQSMLLRAGLDNLTIANNLRIAVDWRKANIDDLLSSRPHGPIRGDGPPSTWIQPIQMPTNVMSEVVPMLQYMDTLRSSRTGIGKGTMGLDADELQNVTKGGQLAAMSAAALIVDLIARMLAEGVKGIFSKIRAELIRHQDKPMQFKIAGKWTEIDPSSWRRDRKITPNVGLGSGNREEMRSNVQMLAQSQAGIVQLGLVGPKQAYETFKVMCEALGFNNPERFAMDPASQEYQQHMQQMQQQQAAQQQPAVQIAQIKAQTETSKQNSEDQRKILDLQGQLIDSKNQREHDQLAQLRQMIHDQSQGKADRNMQLDTNHLQIVLKLIPAIAGILSAEKADANELGPDVDNAAGQIQ